MGAFYHKSLERLALPFTYYVWKFMVGSVGRSVQQPWTARLCIYFWPCFMLVLSPLLALFALWFLGPFEALLMLLFAPPALTLTVVAWVLRLTVGPPFIRFVGWIFTSPRVELVAKVVIILVLGSVVSVVVGLLLFDLQSNFGWLATLGIVVGIIVGVLLAFAVLFGLILLVEVVVEWHDARPPKPPKPERKPREYPAFLRAIRCFFLQIGRGLGAIFSLCILPFYMLYAWYKDFCPVMTYGDTSSNDTNERTEAEPVS